MINYISKKLLKFDKAPPLLKRTPSHFLWAVPSFGEHDKENTESAKIVWPMATSTSLLPTHPKRTLALGYLGRRTALSYGPRLTGPSFLIFLWARTSQNLARKADTPRHTGPT